MVRDQPNTMKTFFSITLDHPELSEKPTENRINISVLSWVKKSIASANCICCLVIVGIQVPRWRQQWLFEFEYLPTPIHRSRPAILHYVCAMAIIVYWFTRRFLSTRKVSNKILIMRGQRCIFAEISIPLCLNFLFLSFGNRAILNGFI